MLPPRPPVPPPLSPEVWELALSNSTVVALTRSRAELHHLSDDRGFVITFALCDVTGLIEKHGVYFGHGRKHDGEKVGARVSTSMAHSSQG